MENLTFEMLNHGWNAIRMSGAPNLRKVVTGLVDPAHILIQRIGETPDTITVLFKGFDQALNNPEQDAPILKRAILAWVKNFAEAQIQRGDPQNFIIRVIKPQQLSTQQSVPATTEQPTPQSVNTPLVNISNVRTNNGR